MWTPADWAWIGGLMNALMSAWYHGVPVLAHRARKFDPEQLGFQLIEHEPWLPEYGLNYFVAVDGISFPPRQP